MKVIAFDLGTVTGWACSGPESGTFDTRPSRYEGGGVRILRFRDHVVKLLDLHKPVSVVFEEVRRHLGTDAAHVYGALMGVLMEECEKRNIAYSGVPVGTIKRHATGKGNAKKDQMIAAAQRLYPGVDIIDDNHADALCLLHYEMKEFGNHG